MGKLADLARAVGPDRQDCREEYLGKYNI